MGKNIANYKNIANFAVLKKRYETFFIPYSYLVYGVCR